MLHLDYSGTTNTTPSPAKAYGKTRLAARLKSQGFAAGSSYISLPVDSWAKFLWLTLQNPMKTYFLDHV